MFDQGSLEIYPGRPYPVVAVAAVETLYLGLAVSEEGKRFVMGALLCRKYL